MAKGNLRCSEGVTATKQTLCYSEEGKSCNLSFWSAKAKPTIAKVKFAFTKVNGDYAK